MPTDPLNIGFADGEKTAIAYTEWADTVRRERTQVEAAREASAALDYYSGTSTSSGFRPDPRRTNDAVLDLLLELVHVGDKVIDIGAGAGRYALPLAMHCQSVLAVEPSPSNIEALREDAKQFDATNLEVAAHQWPMADQVVADVVLAAHVTYDVEQIAEFVDAMEEAADRLCVVILSTSTASSQTADLWQEVYGEPRIRLPMLPDFMSLLLLRGSIYEVRLVEASSMSFATPEQAIASLRRILWTTPGGDKDLLLEGAIARMFDQPERPARISSDPITTGIVSWRPRTNTR